MIYAGGELELFQHAEHWKQYWASEVREHVIGRVLDVGCGLGANAANLCSEKVSSYTFLEPDATLLDQVLERGRLPSTIDKHMIHGTTADLCDKVYDTLLYIDVLEHIDDATAELHRASDLLSEGGHLIIVVPASQFLYSPFDSAIGHFRRYDKKMLSQQMPSTFTTVRTRYLDSVGMLLSLANRILLRKEVPTQAQIDFWDQRIVPFSRVVDKLIGYRVGRSLVAVYRKS